MTSAEQWTALLMFAAQWLVACLLGAAISWSILVFFLRRRPGARQTTGVHRTPLRSEHRGPLFAALFVAAFASANLYIEGHAFAMHAPLLAAPAQILFLLLFYVYPPAYLKGSYAARGIRWLAIIYAFAELAAYIPQQQQQQQQVNNPNVHLTPAQVLAIPGVLGFFLVVGEIFSLGPIIIGILPQVYTRSRHLAQTGLQAPALMSSVASSRARRALIAVAALVAGFALFVLAGLLAPPALLTPDSSAATTAAAFATVTTAPPVLQAARLGFFLLTSLVPVGAGLLLLSGRRYDREALLHRTLNNLALVACLLLVYAAGVVAVDLIFPGFSGPGHAYLPFILPLAVLMGALFAPLRAQIEAQIGRRFFHETYEASAVLAAAGAALPSETHPDQLCERVVTAVEKALRPAVVALWVRPAPSASAFRASGVFAPSMPPAGVGGHALDDSAGEHPSDTGGGHPPDAPTRADATATQLSWYARASDADHSPAPEGAAMLNLRADDPVGALLMQSASFAVDRLPRASSAGGTLRAARTELALPLVSQGELEGLLALAPPPDARPYGEDIRELLAELAGAVAPALHAARVAQRQEVEQRGRERVEQELQTARRIQESLLPKAVPALSGWQIATAYQPAREVGGDFYDFIALADGKLGIVLGDVTDKGIPAALVMATTRSMLRAVATQPGITPDAVLAQVNELLCPDLPASMFVTCFYAVLDPADGRLRYANAGQDLPYQRHADGSVGELHATGMPLGMLPGSDYDAHEATLAPGDGLLFFSDGLVEAHNPAREMFGLPRLKRLLGEQSDGMPPIVALLHALADFTGAFWEQEDDITLVALHCSEGQAGTDNRDAGAASWRTLAAFALPSEPGGERAAITRVTAAVQGLGLAPRRLEDLQTAVGEAVMNAMEHGNHYQPERPVELEVRASAAASELVVRITDQGAHTPIAQPPATAAQAPDLAAKLAEEQSPRGWGLFLMGNLVDAVRVSGDEAHHTVELVLALSTTPPSSPDSP